MGLGLVLQALKYKRGRLTDMQSAATIEAFESDVPTKKAVAIRQTLTDSFGHSWQMADLSRSIIFLSSFTVLWPGCNKNLFLLLF